MPHETALLFTIAAGIGLAFVLGFVASRFRLPPLVGYLLAGVVIGPFTPGFVAHTGVAQELAEIGVILLMFGVGIHFSVADLLAVRRIAVPGALAQITAATVLGAVVAHAWWGWPWGWGIVFGLCLSVASTVVLLRALEDRRMIETDEGRVAVGWLIVEDLATVLVLVVLPAVAGLLGGKPPADGVTLTGGALLVSIAGTLAKVGAFVALMTVVGRRAVPWLLERVARTGSRELFTLAVLAVALGIAVGASTLFGVSFALGAFFAGVVVNGSRLSHEAASDALPLQDAFSVLFFVAVGMLFDPMVLVRRPLEVLTVVAIVMLGKSLVAFFLVLAFRRPVRTALTISASLAQVGEFSFILAGLATTLGLLPAEGHSLIVAAALLSITLNASAFWAVDRAGRWIAERPRLLAVFEHEGAAVPQSSPFDATRTLRGHAVVVGFGRVGRMVGEGLVRCGLPFLVIEDDREKVEALRARGIHAVHGDATRASVLRDAAIEHARLLVVAAPDPFLARAIVDRARSLNAGVTAMARARTDDERRYLEGHGVARAIGGEDELARGLARVTLVAMGTDEDEAESAIDQVRRDVARPSVDARGARVGSAPREAPS